MQIAQIDIQIGGLKRYCLARRVQAVLPTIQLGGTHQNRQHTMVSAPFVDQSGMGTNFALS